MNWYKKMSAKYGAHMKANRRNVFLAESFDGTWIMGMLAASVTERPIEVFIGAIVGLAVIQAFAAELGSRLHGKLPSPEAVQRVMGVVFTVLGVVFLARAIGYIDVDPTALLRQVAGLQTYLFIPAIALMIAGFETFDKTAAVTLHSAATSGKEYKIATFISSMEGLILANAVSALGLGYVIGYFMTPATIELVSGIVFVLVGLFFLVGGKSTVLGWFGVKSEED
jgi:putative Ca2+/H+ antiporter (TMEM165/GDT1 family)